MDIAVCIKQIPDPNTPSELVRGSHHLRREGVDAILDPGDEFGIEAGLALVEAQGGEVRVVCMGPERSVEAVRKALAMGAERAVLATDPALAGADALTTARVLAAAIRRDPFDLVITATESTDGYTGVVPQATAALLGIPALTFARSVSFDGSRLRVERQTENGVETVEATLPALIAVTAGVNEPRYPALKGIMSARHKPLDQVTLGDLGLAAGPTGQEVVTVTAAPQRPAGEVFPDDGSGARRIVELLERAKVI